MNLSTVALLLLAWQMLTSAPSRNAAKKPNLTDLLSDDTKSMLDCVGKISGEGSGEDKIGALLQMAGNPAVMNLVQSIFPRNGAQNTAPAEGKTARSADADNHTSSEKFSASDKTHGSTSSEAKIFDDHRAENRGYADRRSDINDNLTNSEGYRFETPSEASLEFFRPIDNIADAEVKHKLYWFYDNWYVK